MKKIVVINGGRAGAILFSDSGTRSIPAFGEPLQRSLSAASSMVNAVALEQDESVKGKMAQLATGLCNLAVSQVEEIVGPLADKESLVFQDVEGGFTCGSTGRPPIPLPWPPPPRPCWEKLIQDDDVASGFKDAVLGATKKEIPLRELFENPASVAKEVGVPLTRKAADELFRLAPSQLQQIEDPVDQEVVRLFHRVLEDGRFIEHWNQKPYEVAKELRLDISDAALERLVSGGVDPVYFGNGSVAVGPVGIVAIAITGIIAVTVAVTARSPEIMIRDRSGLIKF